MKWFLIAIEAQGAGLNSERAFQNGPTDDDATREQSLMGTKIRDIRT